MNIGGHSNATAEAETAKAPVIKDKNGVSYCAIQISKNHEEGE